MARTSHSSPATVIDIAVGDDLISRRTRHSETILGRQVLLRIGQFVGLILADDQRTVGPTSFHGLIARDMVHMAMRVENGLEA